MNLKRINLEQEPNHINPFLTHWTGKNKDDEKAFEILTTIIENKQLKFSSCETSFPESMPVVNNSMICFTDTPIEQSSNHCKLYGHFGISFSKEELIDYGANPVLYVVDNRKEYRKFMDDFLSSIKTNINNESKNKLSWVISCFQPFDSKKFSGDNWAEYLEREWRIIRVLPLHWLEVSEQISGPYNEFKFKGEIIAKKTSESKNVDEFFLQFDKSIIRNIIVPYDFDIKRAEELIKKNDLNIELIVINK